MKICKNCGKEFSAVTKIDGKRLNSRKRIYCLECNPKGSRKFWGGKLTNKESGIKRDAKVEYVCISCGRKHTNKTRNLECSTCLMRKKRYERKQIAFKLKGEKCAICGYNKCIEALAFHHLDENLKNFTLSGNWGLSWEQIEKELEKCVLLCCRCHAEVHAGITKL